MRENKEVLKYCPNFYKIINFNPIEGDELTDKIIRLYQEYIFKVDLNNSEEIQNIKTIDEALLKYINDYTFRSEVQKEITSVRVKSETVDIIKYFIDTIIKVFKSYSDFNTRVIYISRWI